MVGVMDKSQILLMQWVKKQNLKSKDAAKVLAISASKMSEYLNGKRKVPRYILAHIDTFNALTNKRALSLIQLRLDE